jgi:hypothetical protein
MQFVDNSLKIVKHIKPKHVDVAVIEQNLS